VYTCLVQSDGEEILLRFVRYSAADNETSAMLKLYVCAWDYSLFEEPSAQKKLVYLKY